jgi:hypothetical protein
MVWFSATIQFLKPFSSIERRYTSPAICRASISELKTGLSSYLMRNRLLFKGSFDWMSDFQIPNSFVVVLLPFLMSRPLLADSGINFVI